LGSSLAGFADRREDFVCAALIGPPLADLSRTTNIAFSSNRRFRMTTRNTRSLLCLLSLMSVASYARAQTYSANGDVDLSRASKMLGSREVTILREMSDANIVGHLLEVDSIEIAAADTAIRLSKSDDVRSFAKMMNLTHGGDAQKEREIAKADGLIPTIDVAKLRSSHVARSLDSLRISSDLTIDRHYLMSQVQLHQHALAELEVLQSVARHPDIRQHVTELIPVVQDHLTRAQALAKAKGIEK
jgi:putative membrane protein